MKSKKHLLLAVNAALAITMIAVTTASVSAQDNRPRYSSSQYGERSWTLPVDTVLSVQMNGTLSSRTARVGDKFVATITVPVYVNGRTVIPAGTVVEGRVTQVTPAKRMSRSGTIAIDFDNLVFPNGAVVPLVGNLTSDDPETRRRIDDESRVSGERGKNPAVFIGGGGAIGAVLGGIAGGGKGAVVGGAVGAGVGIAGILLTKGEEAQVPSGTPFGIQLKQALIIRESFTAEQAPADRSDPSADQPADPPDRMRSDRSQPDRSQPDRSQPDVSDRSAMPRPEERADADRPADSGPPLPLSSPEMVRRAQLALRDQGYYEGEADGTMNARTSGALRTYQHEHNLQETGDLDPQTAKSLGITGAPAASRDRAPERSPERPVDPRRDTSSEPADTVMANVLSASANRTSDGSIYVLIHTQANTGGWKWFGEQVVNGDTLEVYARAVRPTGMVTQALSRGRIELTASDGVQYVRRVVVHSAGADQVISLGGGRTDSTADASVAPPPRRGADSSPDTGRSSQPRDRTDRYPDSGGPSPSASSAVALQRKAEDLLSEYQRTYGVRMTGNGVEIENAAQYREPEIELLFAIDSFANAAQLYARLTASLRDRQSLRGATLAMARQARRTDRVISTTTSRGADSLAARWDSIREDVLRLMQSHNIASSEIEN